MNWNPQATVDVYHVMYTITLKIQLHRKTMNYTIIIDKKV